MASSILIYILVYCFIFDVTNALDECKDKVYYAPTCKRVDKHCANPRGDWIAYMEKNCMSTCRYCTTVNVALGKTTKQSSAFLQIGYNSSNAVDGEIQDKYGSCSVTSNSDVKSWWCVDLETQYTLNEIRVFGESKAIDSLTNFTMILSNTGSCDESTLKSSPVCYKDPRSNINLYSIDRCNEGKVDFNGRFVFITTDKEYTSLGLCEVQVYSARCSDGFYESSIGICSPCNCNGESCDPDTGRCLQKCAINCKNDKCDVTGSCTDGCNVGFYGSDCTDKCSPNCKDNVCNEAGVCSDCREGFYGDICSKSCSSCKPGGCRMESGVCNNGCKRGFYGGRCKSNCSTCKDGSCTLGVCTHGCLDGFYDRGGWCLKTCPNCLAGGCNKDTGVCINGCIEGWFTDTCNTSCSSDCQGGCNRLNGECTTCSPGRYGDYCQHECSDGCQVGCNRSTGTCTTCSPGRYGDTCQHKCSIGCQGGCNMLNGECTTCYPGRYGDYCQHECSNGCLDNICNKDGSCNCKATHYGDNCNITCSDGCMDNKCSSYGGSCLCKITHYGEKCEQECSNKCIDRQCTASPGLDKPRCTLGCINGYKGSYCQSPCPVNCVTCNTTVCSVCKPGWYGNMCQTPCPIKCPNECHSVSGECEQCLGNTFGRSCNSTCSDRCRSHGTDKTCNIAGDCLFGCVDGNYGNSCNKLCSPGCNTGCYRNGKCHNCTKGYHADKCDLKCAKFCRRGCSRQVGRCNGCVLGYYGNYCNKPCSSTCLEGCKRTGGYCNACITGYYGRTCNQTCSKTCEGGCNRDGKCLRCSKGFYGDYCEKNCSNNCIDSDCEGPIDYLNCSKGCVEGKTGRYCSKNCPQHCINCDQFNRNLCSACKDRWRGSVCSQPCSSLSVNCIKCHQDLPRCYSCKSGWFGKRCNDACPTGCLDDTCNLNGTCESCNSGSFGPMCNETCPIGCLDDICNMDGTCEACNHGYYGITCDKMCSTNCKSSSGLTVCNITDGSCIDDCGDGTSGQNCKEDCEMGYYGSNCDEVCHCYQSQCDQDTGVCDYGCKHGWMGSRCDQVKAPAEVATYCVNSPTKGKYALLRVDTKNIKYDKIYIINESQDTPSSITCDLRMFNEDADGVLNLKILIEDGNTSPSCYHTKTDRGVLKWTLRTEEVSGFYSYYDRLYELSCDFTTAETLTRNNKQAISGIYQPSKVKITQTTEEVQLFIQNPATASRVSQVQIGSRIQLAMLLNTRDGITASGISPYNCSCSTPDGKTVHLLTDSSGCPVRDSPVLALTGSNGSYLTSNIFDAFTVEGSLGLIFSCSFEFCFDSNDTKCTDRCSDQRTRSILGVTSRTKRSTNGNKKNGQASTYLLLIPKTQKDKQTDMNNISVEGTVSKHLTVITGSILVLVLCGGLVAVVLLVRTSRIKTVMKQTNVKITE